MNNALPILFGPLESPPHVTGQAGGVGRDQAGTTENSSINLFAKIFRNQTTAASFLNSVSKTRSGEDGGGSKLDWLHGTQALSGDTLPSLYLASLLENNGQGVPQEGAVVGNSSIPLRAEGVNENSTGGQVESQSAQFELLPGSVPHNESVINGNVAPMAFLQGKLGGEIRQPAGLGIQAGLPLLAGTPSSQTAVRGSMLADQSAAPFVPKVDSERVLQNALATVDGKAVTESDANQLNTVNRILNPVQETGPRLLQNTPSPIGLPQESIKPANTPVNQAFQVPKPFEETPAGIADAAQLSQNRLKYVSGVSSVLSESPANGKESSIGIPLDRLGDANVSLTGDRSRDVMEVTGKAEGVDPNAGQGLNHGMGNPTHSQSGFQQSSSASSPGQAVRMAEERVPDLPGPALQRLQMEVQLSETNRVQIDVGVQHRQVYASLLMDHATLKNLAVQFVPQLEEQLTQGEMELQEFSAEVRDHQGGQESDTRSDGAGMQTSQEGTTFLHQTPVLLSHRAGGVEEQGFHLVA
jgi:hypothetical protein